MENGDKVFKPIDQEEKELMESIERDEWQPVSNLEEEKEKAVAAARNALKKDKRINLRLTQKECSSKMGFLSSCCDVPERKSKRQGV